MLVKIKQLLQKHYLFFIFSALYFAISFFTYKDYGITFDEKVEYDAGAYLLKHYTQATTPEYVSKLVYDVPNNIEQRHLPIFSVYSRIYPMLLSLINTQGYFEWYHLLNLFFGYFLFFFSYLLFFCVYKKQKLAIIAPVTIFLTPYISGHIPANPKDIPFATSYLMGLFFIYFFGDKKRSNRKPLILGLVFGLSTALRVAGLTLFAIYIFYDVFIKKQKVVDVFAETLIAFFICLFTWVVLLPYLGTNFIGNLPKILTNASSFKSWRGQVFYLGQYFGKDDRPWHYLFVLMGVKLPVVFLFFFVFGIFKFFRNFALQKEIEAIKVLLLTAIGLNVFLYLILHPVVYNGIRHFLYLLVPVVLFSALHIAGSFEKASALALKNQIILGYFLFTFLRMIHLHPYEYVYFNELIFGLRGAESLFQLDYWGASYKEASEYVRDLASSKGIENLNVFSCDNWYAVVYFSEFEFSLVGSPKEADILICDTFRDDIRKLSQPILHQIKRENVPLTNIRVRPDYVFSSEN